ncbi:hypothetical protein [Dinoroseobacter sp. S375]|uniref:hypothetical protein n=1 Tax=Dinoroseobacter sp. S375 TaxID=3415136 RepID=UPI003C7AB367
MTEGPEPKDDMPSHAQDEARVFAALEEAARVRAAADARDRLVLASARPSRLTLRLRAWLRGSRGP